MPKQHTTPRTDAEEWVDRINWFVACLEDRIAGNVVRGLSEAEAGYDSALDETVTELARLRGIEEQLETALAVLRLVDECGDALTEDGYSYLIDAAREGIASSPAAKPATGRACPHCGSADFAYAEAASDLMVCARCRKDFWMSEASNPAKLKGQLKGRLKEQLEAAHSALADAANANPWTHAQDIAQGGCRRLGVPFDDSLREAREAKYGVSSPASSPPEHPAFLERPFRPYPPEAWDEPDPDVPSPASEPH